ncbi:hypothetical protein [Tunturiibacter gelidiferens]|uniref:hypothetical protein n=1 Tax=Tunturiibacter gelidiferens TaxID=3069689 RepID=UPI003D9B7DC7
MPKRRAPADSQRRCCYRYRTEAGPQLSRDDASIGTVIDNQTNPNGNKPALFLQNGFPTNTLNPANVSLSTLHIHAMQANSPTPSTQEWSIGFQRELPARMVLTMDYVGTKSSNLTSSAI